MDIPPIQPAPPPVTFSASLPNAAARQVGEIITATVLRILANGEAELRIGSNRVQVNYPQRLTPGQALTLQVERTGERPQFKVIAETTPLTQALRAALPRQRPISPLLNQLAGIARATPQQAAELPGPTLESVRRLVDALPTLRQVSDEAGLRRAIRDSGTFLEARLATAPSSRPESSPNLDLKANLLRLLASLRTATDSTSTTARAAATAPAGAQTRAAPAEGQASVPSAVAPSTRRAAFNLTTYDRPSLPASGPGPAPPNPSAPTSAAPAGQAAPTLSAPSAPAASPTPDPAPATPGGESRTRHAEPAASPRPPATGPDTGRPRGDAGAGGRASAPAPSIPMLPLPPSAELQQQVESSLARVQLNQLGSLPVDDPAKPWLSIEVPIRHSDRTDVLHLRIDRDTGNASADYAHRWRVTVTFDLPELGPSHATVTLVGQTVSTEFWAGQETTAELFRRNLDSLRDSMARMGLAVGSLRCHSTPLVDPALSPQRGTGILNARV